MGHDLQDDSRAEGIHRLRRAHRGASGGTTRRSEGQGARRAGRLILGLRLRATVADERGDQSPNEDHGRLEREKREQAGSDRIGVGVAEKSPGEAASMIASRGSKRLLPRKNRPRQTAAQNTSSDLIFRVAQLPSFWLYPRAFRSG